MAQRRMITAMLAVRDAWQEQVPDGSVRNRPFRTFRDWMMSAYQSADSAAIGPVTELLKLVVGANPSNYTPETLTKKAEANVHRRSYRYTFACDGERANYRVRHFFLAYIGLPGITSIQVFLCHPWIAGPQERAANSAGEYLKFRTEPATSFERILTLCLLRKVNTELASLRGRKRGSASSSDASSNANMTQNGVPVMLRTMSMPTFHRFCYAVQKVASCWSFFVRRYGWEDIEAFLHPYVLYNPTTVSMSVIQTRVEGFPVESDVSATEWPAVGELTTVQQACFTAAFQADANTDDIHRKAAQAFLDHAFRVVTSSTLYRAPNAEAWGTGIALTARSRWRPAPALQTALPDDVKTHFSNLQPTRSSGAASSSGSRGGARSGGVQDTSSNATGRRAATEAAAASSAQPRDSQTASTAAPPPRSVLRPPPTTTEVQEAVQTVKTFLLGRYVHAYNCSFDDISESYDSLGNDNRELSSRVQLVLCDPPFNVRRERGLNNSEYDRLSFADMKRLVNRVTELVRKGGHIIIMCSREQHVIWQRLFQCATEDGYDDDPTAPEVEDTHDDPYNTLAELRDLPTTDLYGITSDPLLFLNKPHHYPHGARYSATHQNGVQYAFHAKRSGVTAAQERDMVDWRSHNYVRSTYPATKHIIDNVPRLAPGEQVRMIQETVVEGEEPDDAESAEQAQPTVTRTRALRAEQKQLPLLKELVCRYSRPGDMVVDFFSGTFSTAVAAITLPEHRIFIGTELDKACYDIAVDSMCRRVAVHLATNRTDISIPRAVRHSMELLQAAHVRARARDDMWEAPPRMPQYQCLPEAVVAAVAALGGNPDWMLEYMTQPVHRWAPAMQVALQTADDELLLQADCAATGVIVMKSTVKHPNAGQGCFAARCFQEGELIGSYYGTLVYHNLFERKNAPRKEYGHGVMLVTRDTYLKFAFRINLSKNAHGFNSIPDLTDGRASVHVVPPSFCSMRYINDARYLPGDPDKQRFSDGGGRKPNVGYHYAARDVKSPKDLEPNGLVEVRASRLINPGEELFGDYGAGYASFNTDDFHEGKV